MNLFVWRRQSEQQGNFGNDQLYFGVLFRLDVHVTLGDLMVAYNRAPAWTEEEKAFLKARVADGWDRNQIAEAMPGRTLAQVRHRMDYETFLKNPDRRCKKLGGFRRPRGQFVKDIGERAFDVPESVWAARERRYQEMARMTPSQLWFGDPVPSQSALGRAYE